MKNEKKLLAAFALGGLTLAPIVAALKIRGLQKKLEGFYDEDEIDDYEYEQVVEDAEAIIFAEKSWSDFDEDYIYLISYEVYDYICDLPDEKEIEDRVEFVELSERMDKILNELYKAAPNLFSELFDPYACRLLPAWVYVTVRKIMLRDYMSRFEYPVTIERELSEDYEEYFDI